ncbi:MAG: hypothetical protein H6Q73_97 [Firmicutes bacterium]|nr:hypothetical protein [Bacillota bacterium]
MADTKKILGGLVMRKVLLVTFVLLMSLTTLAFANGIYDEAVVWTAVPSESLAGISYAYAPEFTRISPQGRLETVIKSTQPSTHYLSNYLIEKTYVTPAFDRYIIVACGKFKQDGSTIKISPECDKDWRPLLPGTQYEQCLQAAYQYAKSKK